MELRKIVWRGVVVIALTTLAASAALIGITSYLHHLTGRIDSNLQSVRAAEEIQLQLLWHARHLHLANMTGNAAENEAAAQTIEELRRWFATAEQYATASDEADTLQRLGAALDGYLADQARLAHGEQPPADQYLAAIAPFQNAYDDAQELLRINVEQAAMAANEAQVWDTVATWIGASVAAILLIVVGTTIAGARTIVYRPLLALRDGIRQFDARASARLPENGAREIGEIAHAFNGMAATLGRQRDAQLSFIASVAHDLRNPLSAIKIAVDALATRAAAPPGGRTASALAIVSRQTDVLMRLISDLLDSARVEAGRFEISPVPCDARELVHRSVELFSPTTVLHELIVHVPEEALTVRCDPARMEQVMNNLVSNAIKYSPNGGAIVVSGRRDDDHVLLEVRDHGLGIALGEQQHIFEPFRRGGALDDAIPGVGLGLSAARSIVRAHGGEITVTSVVGQGSVFALRVPVGSEH